MISVSTKHHVQHLIFLLVILLLANHQVLLSGYPYGDDWIFELVRIVQFSNALETQQFPPLWADDTYAGYGSPDFIFYAPLYLLINFVWLQAGIPTSTAAYLSIMLLQVISMLAITAIFIEFQHNESEKALHNAKIAIAAFILSPYIMSDLLIRNAGAELTALYLTPLVIHAGIKVFRRHPYSLVYLVFSIALIILSHNLTALTVAALITITSLILLTRGYPQSSARILIGLLLAIAATSWFWYPALSMKSLVPIHNLTSDRFVFSSNFTAPLFLFHYKNPLSTGPLTLFCLLTGMYVLYKGSLNRILIITLIGFSVVFIFLQISQSSIVWETLPFMELFQFPYRMMGPLALLLALLLGYCFRQLNFRYAFTVIMMLILANSLIAFWSYRPFTPEITRHLEEILGRESIRLNRLPTTVRDEYLPLMANKQAMLNRGITDTLLQHPVETGIGSHTSRGDGVYSIETDFDSDRSLVFRTWAFPVWQVSVDNKRISHYADENGMLGINVPSGRHTIELTKVQPASRTAGIIVSIASLLLLAVITLIVNRRNGMSTLAGKIDR
jgi:hypothetical protein